ncbi:hypothetical protein RvY_05363 [Ramazzottius varieornatus]|uniref:HDAg domain-containing protein n=1 Tax=Ramazzottius varieornatus TaxID=947166 RepID=A0A1D1UUR0_RAMVA|nr:hypothetical protein RvY_05363 [Ramazzottius varieornatus]
MSATIPDIPQWLLNKLGSSERTWVDGNIAPHLNKDVLKGIYDCFLELQPSLKIKLLLSILHIVRRNLETLRPELEDIIELGIKDTDQWVSLTAEFLKFYPLKGEFNTALLDNAEVFEGLKADLKRHLMKLGENSNGLLFVPDEAEFMTKTAFTATYGNIAPPPKHLTLKQKPKSAILRAEALTRASLPLAKSKTEVDSTLPMRYRDRFKPIDSIITPSQLSATKKNYVASTSARIKASASAASSKCGVRPGVKLIDTAETPRHLLSAEERKKRKKADAAMHVSTSGNEGRPEGNADILPEHDTDSTDEEPPETVEHRELHGQENSPEVPEPKRQHVESACSVPPVSSSGLPAPVPPRPPSPREPVSTTSEAGPSRLPIAVSAATSQPPVVLSNAIPLADFRNVKLSKEVQKAIADTFANANRVTRPEKILIINFIAGVRDNPCPHLGPVLTIRLSEHPARTTLSNGQEVDAVVEEYFHMDFNTGDWKRLRKQKPLVNAAAPPQH